jgi:hypothetical protein
LARHQKAIGTGTAYVILDGKTVASDRCHVKTVSRKGREIDLWYPGKKPKGVNELDINVRTRNMLLNRTTSTKHPQIPVLTNYIPGVADAAANPSISELRGQPTVGLGDYLTGTESLPL